MSENKIVLITARRDTAKSNYANNLKVGDAFKDVAGFEIIGSDNLFSIRAAIPLEGLDEFKARASEKYVVEDDYVLKILESSPEKVLGLTKSLG